MGLAPHLRSAGADRGAAGRRVPGQSRGDQRDRAGSSRRSGSSGGPGIGDRREYFSAPPQAFRAILQGASTTYRRFREVTEHGLGVIADRPPPTRRRLQEVHDFLLVVEGELPVLLERFAKEQARLAAAEDATPGSDRDGRDPGLTARARPIRRGRGESDDDRHHPDREAHQVLRVASRHRGRRPRRRRGRGVRVPGAQRRGQDDDDPGAPRSPPSDVGRGPSSGSRRPSIRSRSTAGSATCRASSPCTTS